jgi:hypothetical protein
MIPQEYKRAARIFEALYFDWQDQLSNNHEAQWWFHTGLFDLLIPDSLTVLGETEQSKTAGAKRRREHVVPRLAIATRCIEMFKEGKTVDEVAVFLQQYLKIVWVSSKESVAIDLSSLCQKSDMPKEAGKWWLTSESLLIRLKRANVQFNPM